MDVHLVAVGEAVAVAVGGGIDDLDHAHAERSAVAAQRNDDRHGHRLARLHATERRLRPRRILDLDVKRGVHHAVGGGLLTNQPHLPVAAAAREDLRRHGAHHLDLVDAGRAHRAVRRVEGQGEDRHLLLGGGRRTLPALGLLARLVDRLGLRRVRLGSRAGGAQRDGEGD